MIYDHTQVRLWASLILIQQLLADITYNILHRMEHGVAAGSCSCSYSRKSVSNGG
jgi:hypothetical protein